MVPYLSTGKVRSLAACVGLIYIVWQLRSMLSLQLLRHTAQQVVTSLPEPSVGLIPISFGTSISPEYDSDQSWVNSSTLEDSRTTAFSTDHGEGSVIEGQNITDLEVLELTESILNIDSVQIPRLKCPGELAIGDRYEIIRTRDAAHGIQYLFALNLFEARDVLNRLMASIIQVVRYLGPKYCAISIVEGRSSDGTYQVLDALTPHLSHLGLKYWLQRSDIDPLADGKDRIEELSKLRNLALEPLLRDVDGLFGNQAQIIFANDVLLCPDDLLELLYQHQIQGAVQSCAMDWIEHGKNFYDVWVSRTVTGNPFWHLPATGDWTFVNDLFRDDPPTKAKFARREPFQVFSCWGGLTVLQSHPFRDRGLRFRRSFEEECYGGEPQLLASDLTRLDLFRIQTVPTVNIGYENDALALDVKKEQGYVHDRVNVSIQIDDFAQDTLTARIAWDRAPDTIRCMPNMGDEFWVSPVYGSSSLDANGS